MERLACAERSDRRQDPAALRTGEPPKKVAFVQCAGSRDVNHLPYCSAVCCLASLKQAIYVHEQLPGGRGHDLLHRPPHAGPQRGRADQGGRRSRASGWSRARSARSTEARTAALVLKVEDVESGQLDRGAGRPGGAGHRAWCRTCGRGLPFDAASATRTASGSTTPRPGLVVAGVARRPEDVAASVRDATGAAAKASWRPEGGRRWTRWDVFLCTGCGIGEALDLDGSRDACRGSRARHLLLDATPACARPRAWRRSRARSRTRQLDGVLIAACSLAGQERGVPLRSHARWSSSGSACASRWSGRIRPRRRRHADAGRGPAAHGSASGSRRAASPSPSSETIDRTRAGGRRRPGRPEAAARRPGWATRSCSSRRATRLGGYLARRAT